MFCRRNLTPRRSSVATGGMNGRPLPLGISVTLTVSAHSRNLFHYRDIARDRGELGHVSLIFGRRPNSSISKFLEAASSDRCR